MQTEADGDEDQDQDQDSETNEVENKQEIDIDDNEEEENEEKPLPEGDLEDQEIEHIDQRHWMSWHPSSSNSRCCEQVYVDKMDILAWEEVDGSNSSVIVSVS